MLNTRSLRRERERSRDLNDGSPRASRVAQYLVFVSFFLVSLRRFACALPLVIFFISLQLFCYRGVEMVIDWYDDNHTHSFTDDLDRTNVRLECLYTL